MYACTYVCMYIGHRAQPRGSTCRQNTLSLLGVAPHTSPSPPLPSAWPSPFAPCARSPEGAAGWPSTWTDTFVSQCNILEDYTVFGHPLSTQTPWFPPNPDQDLDRHSAGGLEGVGQERVKEAERDRVLVAAGIIEPPGSCAEGQERAVAELVAAVHLEHLEALHTRHTQMRDTYVTYDRHT